MLKPQTNQYTGIAQYYDLMMTAGYYDYEDQSDSLAQVLKSCNSVLELGVGTGLIAEKLIEKLPEIEFVGIDVTESMLLQAQSRLGESVVLRHEDILKMDLNQKFDAAFSNGGVWYFIEKNSSEYIFCSHLYKIQEILKSFQNVAKHLTPGGHFIFSVQGVRQDYDLPLSNEVTYSQKISPLPYDRFDKHYMFSRNNVILAEQICRYQLLPEQMAKILLYECGFEFESTTANNIKFIKKNLSNDKFRSVSVNLLFVAYSFIYCRSKKHEKNRFYRCCKYGKSYGTQFT